MSASATSTPTGLHSHPTANRHMLGWISAIGMSLFFLLALLVFPPLSDAGKPIASPQWMMFFGRFHPIAVHMPVGVLILAAVMEGLVLVRRRHTHLIESAITFVLGIGATGAIVTVIFGIFLAREGGTYNNGQFYAHQALGIVATIFAILAFVIKLVADQSPRFMWPYRVLLALALGVMSIGAHFGGNMIYGREFLIEFAPAFIKDSVTKTEDAIIARFAPPQKPGDKSGGGKAVDPGSSGNPTVYAAFVAPVLEKNCNSCHNERKSKAKLRMDSYELLIKGGSSGDNVVAGDTAKSLMIARMLLPKEDDDHMPPPDEKQPSKEEIDLLTWWVKEGASNTVKVADAKLPDGLKAFAQTLLANSKGGSAGSTPPLILAFAEGAAAADPAVAQAMKKINASGAALEPLAADSKELRFTALNVAKDFTDANLKDLEPIADKIAALDLAKTKVTDAACAVIAKMKNLRELHLEGTAVTDAGAAQLKALTNLEYLNLYGSKITDKTLAELGGLTKIKSFYAWQTGVTEAGAKAFKAAHPSAVMNTGWTDADNAKVVAVAADAPPVLDSTVTAKAAAPQPAAKSEAPVPAAIPVASVVPASAKGVDDNAVVYKDIIAPVIAAKCTKCHGTEKSKGKLRMHTFADLMKGGGDGATTVIAGKTDDSLMLKRIKLSTDDDDHMPPKDEKQVTKEELVLLTWWVEQGASETMTVGAAKKTAAIEAALKTVSLTKPETADASKPAKPKAKPLTDAEKKAAAEVTVKIAALNASLMPLALDTEQLRFGCVNAADKFGDKEVALLEPVAGQLLWVDLARSKVTDAALGTIGKMTQLERLHLENTVVTDAGMAQLVSLKNLEYLNLYGTKVTDAGIAKLAANKALKKLFVWQTGVTKEGAKKLEAAVPGLVVNTGLSEAEIAKLVEQGKPATPAPEAKKGDAKAKKGAAADAKK